MSTKLTKHVVTEAIAEGILEGLAFAEAPERYAVPGPFDVARFRFTKKAKLVAFAVAEQLVSDLGLDTLATCSLLLVDVGHTLAYARNGHDYYFKHQTSADGDVELYIRATAIAHRRIECEFRKRGDKIVMNIWHY